MNTDNKDLRILIVDDTVKNIQVLGTILKQEEYQINVAQNGKQALDVVGKVRPDLILLDVMMPEMDGFEACTHLKQNPETVDIPVIFLTAKIETEDIVKGFELGAVDYVTKPFNPTELLVRVRTHLSIHLLQSALKHALTDISRMQREQESFLKRELQSRLAPIQQNAEALIQGSGGDPQAILDSVQGLAGLVGQLQHIQELESGQVAVQKNAVELLPLVESATAELRALYGDLINIQCNNELTTSTVNVDPNLMIGAFQNLFQHAVEHVAPLTDPTVSIHLVNEGTDALVNVSYGGEAVPPEQLAMFFEKFNADMPNTEGTGLETNYAYLVTAANGGEISVISDDVAGTTVTIKLPS
ncbi:MAG: response regulator [Candidatus Latescibacteria bacterium]|jgi:two-component system, sensor histidine kinase and response regulator|nr:response regulator [Candidatus Latescibacterota bacterium]MBT4140756.1 response regulator [Candidatus Latescibacterota bacterium]MBT5832058.1 response regulator [Candidatus Latescibacterota bacterium]